MAGSDFTSLQWEAWGDSAPSADEIATTLYVELVSMTPGGAETDEEITAIGKECARQAYILADALIRERNARLQAQVLN